MMHLVVLLCMAIMPLTQSQKLHELMTPDEVMGIFHTTHDAVPDYEVVTLKHSRSRRDTNKATQVQFTAFGNDIELYLFPTEGYLARPDTPLWLARSDPRAPESIRYTPIPNALKSIGIPLQNQKTGASLLYTPTKYGRGLFDGFLATNLVIRSLPNRLIDRVLYGKNGLYNTHFNENITEETDNLIDTYHHIVYKKKPARNYIDFKMKNPPVDGRKVPDVIFPEIMVVIDYNLYLLLGRNVEQAKRYIVSFWNAVDLRYRAITLPKIRLNIAGIIISLDADATPYLEQSRVDVALADADKALRGMADYFYREARFPPSTYDVALTMTQLDLCNIIYEDICDPSTLGYAYVAGACDRNHTKQSSEAVGLVEDNGGFSGIIPAAHELGHLIGARHDGHPTAAAECGPYDGFIMTSGLLLDEKGFEWSNCSMNAFYKFLNEDRAKCLYNELKPGNQIRRFLPGKLMSLDAQCKKVYGTGACNKDSPTVCTRLECEIPGSDGLCRATAPAAEGSPCGNGKFCLNGKCVIEDELTKKQDAEVHQSMKFKFPRKRKIFTWN